MMVWSFHVVSAASMIRPLRTNVTALRRCQAEPLIPLLMGWLLSLLQHISDVGDAHHALAVHGHDGAVGPLISESGGPVALRRGKGVRNLFTRGLRRRVTSEQRLHLGKVVLGRAPLVAGRFVVVCKRFLAPSSGTFFPGAIN
jgi:hypothetical protein